MTVKPKLTKGQAILLSVFIIIPFFGVSGCVTAFSLFKDKPEQYDAWVNLGSPPAKVEHLLAADTATIYVQTTDDRIFSCYRESNYDQDCWNEVNSIPPVWEDQPECRPLDNMPQEPDGVIERLNNRHCIDSPAYDGNHWFSYILLTDGTVMQWISEPIGWFGPPNVSNRFFLKLFGGTIVGFLVGIVVSLYVFRSRVLVR